MFALSGALHSQTVLAQQTKKPFSVADEIELWSLIPDLDGPTARFSPDGTYFAVYSTRGRVDLNRPEDSIRIYRSRDVKNFLDDSSDASRNPSPVWVISLASDKEGAIIQNWRWLSDSSGVAFLQRLAGGHHRLVLADIRKKVMEPLSSPTESVRQFDIRNRNHYVYTTLDMETYQVRLENQTPFVVGTGRQLYELVLPYDAQVIERFSPRRYVLRAVVAGKRIEINKDGVPVVPVGDLALSPDGHSLVTELSVLEVPKSWEMLYPQPPSSPSGYGMHAGRQDQESDYHKAAQYVLIDLRQGSAQLLTGAPTGESAHWQALGPPGWSSNGDAVVLPGTFVKPNNDTPSRPCITVVDLPSKTCSCVEMLKGGAEAGFHTIWQAQFASGNKQRVLVRFNDREHTSIQVSEYRRAAEGIWKAVGQREDTSDVAERGFDVTTKQGLNQPPLLVASNAGKSRVIWDPNPQLQNIELGEASIYTWKGKEGQSFKGGLYKPVNYHVGTHYPLVVQTHGFDESIFTPAGIAFPNGFAARALAAAGFIVLQVKEGCPSGDPSEGPCVVSTYESGARQLVSDGLADPDKIGIIGFSRSCYYVMETLTFGSLHLKAALITDGWMVSYSQYMQWPSWFSREGDAMIGAAPFGDGLQMWLKRSPEFNLDKITTPLLVVADGPMNALYMWQPYAALHYLKKPVDFMMLNTHEHILTNPAVRMASQGGSVDWFRFWLKDEEDPDAAKADQYARWRELRKMQKKKEDTLARAQPVSN